MLCLAILAALVFQITCGKANAQTNRGKKPYPGSVGNNRLTDILRNHQHCPKGIRHIKDFAMV